MTKPPGFVNFCRLPKRVSKHVLKRIAGAQVAGPPPAIHTLNTLQSIIACPTRFFIARR